MISLIFGIGLVIYLLSALVLCVIYGYRSVEPSGISILVLILPLVNTLVLIMALTTTNKSEVETFKRKLWGKTYSKPLTIELLNEVMEKVEKWHKEEDAAFLRIYSTAQNDIPNFDDEVDKMIKETIKKNCNISFEEGVEYTDEQRKAFLKNNWWNKLK